MNTAWIRPLLIRSGHWIRKNAPHILMGMGTTGSISAVIFAAKATPAAIQAVKDAEFEKSDNSEHYENGVYGVFKKDIQPLTKWETVKAAAPYYIPAAGMELFSLLCFWGAHGIDVKRQAILAGLYSTAETALQEYQRKVVEMLGKDGEQEVRKSIAQDHIDRDPPPSMMFEPNEDYWCYYKGYKFRSSWHKLKEIQNEANAEMIKHLYLSESDLLWMFDPDRRYIVPDKDSRLVGFCVDRLLAFDILPTLTPDHQPAFEINIRDDDGLEYLPFPGYSASL